MSNINFFRIMGKSSPTSPSYLFRLCYDLDSSEDACYQCTPTTEIILCYDETSDTNACNQCAPVVYYNTTQSGSATRNNCPSGYTGSSVTLTVPANAYSSLISVEDANNQAIAYINANKQANANTYGTCTYPYGTLDISSQSNSSSTSTACTYSLPNSVYVVSGDGVEVGTQLYTNTTLTTAFNGGLNWWHMRSGGFTYAVYIDTRGVITNVVSC